MATTELASRGGHRGSLSLDLTGRRRRTGAEGDEPQLDEPRVDLSLGNELLAGHVPGYEHARFHRVPGYTVEHIFEAFTHAQVGSPAGEDDGLGADGWFSGVLILDALVANTDRHHQNWGVLETAGVYTLAPSFDHASSLGFQLSDADRSRELDRGIGVFAGRGVSRQVEGRPSLLALAQEAARRSGTVHEWRSRLESVLPGDLDTILERIPDGVMSLAARTFVIALLAENRRRLLDALDAP